MQLGLAEFLFPALVHMAMARWPQKGPTLVFLGTSAPSHTGAHLLWLLWEEADRNDIPLSQHWGQMRLSWS